jgi:hypothetical protein
MITAKEQVLLELCRTANAAWKELDHYTKTHKRQLVTATKESAPIRGQAAVLSGKYHLAIDRVKQAIQTLHIPNAGAVLVEQKRA